MASKYLFSFINNVYKGNTEITIGNTTIGTITYAVTLDDVQYDYGSNILEGNSESVLLEDTAVSSIIESPVASGINISVHFYNKDSEEELQKNMYNMGVMKEHIYLVQELFMQVKNHLK